LEKEIDKQYCPICKTEIKPFPRYPRYLCKRCSEKAVSSDGRPLGFLNESISGGFVAFFGDTKEKYDSHICFVEGIKCFADEARFGGIVIQTVEVTLKDQIAGGLIGMLVGDALGVPYEFHEKDSIPPFEEIEFEPPKNFRRAHAGVPIGTYSDDGAQALILLNTLLECGKFDAEHFAKGLVDWYEVGFFAVDNKVFDCGIQTAKAIAELKAGTKPLLVGGKDEYSNGNGSLMRVLPLALWHQGTDLELIIDAFDQSALTHGHLRSQICCAIYCLWARGILNYIENPLKHAFQTFREMFEEITAERKELETKICPDELHIPEGSGYVVDSFFSAKWANNNEDFESVVKAAISLGNDTDTTACIAGGIAGLKYGINVIPKRWQENLRGKNLFLPLLEKLLESKI
jgi:ADP-ribosylglycohydrolase